MSHVPTAGAIAAATPLEAPAGALAGLDPEREGNLFWWVRLRQISNSLRRSPESSRLRVTLVFLLTTLVWSMLFVLGVDGFEFLNSSIQDPATHDETLRAMYSFFFASLTVLLAFSGGIVVYGALYRSTEVRLLMTTPTSDERIFLHKFQESMFLSSWMFLLLLSPVLLAYGLVEGAGGWYYVLLLPYLLAFAFLPASWGAWCCLMLVRFFPTGRIKALTAAIVTAVIVGLGMLWFVASEMSGDIWTPGWFQELLTRLQVSEYRLLPSWWLASGLIEGTRAGWPDDASRRALTECLMFLALLVSNALFFHLIALWTARKVFRPGYLLLEGSRSARRPFRLDLIERLLMRFAFPLSTELRLLIIKDLRLLVRDPAQWSQFLIFSSLLVLYFLNSQRLTQNVDYAAWINMISFLNLTVVGLILSTFTTRFVYPMLSLEGRRFWILGLLPIRRETLLWGKYLFAAAGSFPPCLGLVALSDTMLGVSGQVIALHALTCVLLCSGLSAIAVGLGAKLPSLHHDSPARIAAGFGGTVTLVVSTVYILLTVLLTALPCHFFQTIEEHSGASTSLMRPEFRIWLLAGVIASVVVGLICTAVPLVLGLRALRRLEV